MHKIYLLPELKPLHSWEEVQLHAILNGISPVRYLYEGFKKQVSMGRSESMASSFSLS